MALQIDGFSVLRSISNHAGTFNSVKAAAEKAATDLVIKQMKGPSFDLENLKNIESAIGYDAFVLITELLSSKDLPKILKKVDPNFSELKTAEAPRLRTRVQDLACSRAIPATKPSSAGEVASSKGGRKKQPQKDNSRALSSKAMGARRKAG